MDTLEAPRLPAAHHPSAESDIAAFCPSRMQLFAHQEWEGKHIVKGVGTRNEASPESVRPVIRPVPHDVINVNHTMTFLRTP